MIYIGYVSRKDGVENAEIEIAERQKTAQRRFYVRTKHG